MRMNPISLWPLRRSLRMSWSGPTDWRRDLAPTRAVGRRVAQELTPHLSADTIGLFVFPDGMSAIFDTFFAANFDDFLAGLEGNLPSDRFLPLWGGGAGNDFDAGAPTYQY